MLLTILVFLALAETRVVAYLAIHSFECTPSTILCPILTCNVNMSRNKVPLINCGCWLARPMYNLTADLLLSRKNGRKYDTIVKIRGNVCDLVRKTNRLQGLARVFEPIKQYFSKFECPFQGNVTATNIPMTLTFAPGFLKSSIYFLQYNMTDKKDFVLLVQLKFAIGIKYRMGY